MSYVVEKVHAQGIVFRLLPGYDFDKDSQKAQKDIAALLDQIKAKPIYLVTNFSQIEMSFSDLVLQLGNNTRGREGSISDKRVRNLFVGTDELVSLAADSLIQTQYGKLPTLVFPTEEEAIRYVEAVLS
jgi:hypothetical protein